MILSSRFVECCRCKKEKLCTIVFLNDKKVEACLACQSRWKRELPYRKPRSKWIYFRGKRFGLLEFEMEKAKNGSFFT